MMLGKWILFLISFAILFLFINLFGVSYGGPPNPPAIFEQGSDMQIYMVENFGLADRGMVRVNILDDSWKSWSKLTVTGAGIYSGDYNVLGSVRNGAVYFSVDSDFVGAGNGMPFPLARIVEGKGGLVDSGIMSAPYLAVIGVVISALGGFWGVGRIIMILNS